MKANSCSKKAFVIVLVLLTSLVCTSVVEAILMNIKISSSLVEDGDVFEYAISPNGLYTVFIADAEQDAVFELYSVLSSGGSRVALSPQNDGDLNVLGFRVSPDSQSVVYGVGSGVNQVSHVYAVPITGGTRLDLTGLIAANLCMEESQISPDSKYLVYVLSECSTTPANPVLYKAPLDGSAAPTPLSKISESSIDLKFKIIPDGSGVIYTQTLTGLGGSKLYSAPLEGDVGMVLDGADKYLNFEIAPDGSKVIFIEHPLIGNDELFSITLPMSTPKNLNGPLVMNGDVKDFKIWQMGTLSYVIYRADEKVDGKFELFRVSLDGSVPSEQMITGMPSFGDVVDYKVSPNSFYVVYTADQLVDERIDLGSINLLTGGIHWLNEEIAGNDVTSFEFAPVSVVFIQEYIEPGTGRENNLWLSPIDGGDKPMPIGYTPFSPGDRYVLDFKIAPNSQFILYRGSSTSGGVYNLFLTVAGDLWNSIQINDTLVSGGEIHDYLISPNSKGVVYRADQETETVSELFSVFDHFKTFLPIMLK